MSPHDVEHGQYLISEKTFLFLLGICFIVLRGKDGFKTC